MELASGSISYPRSQQDRLGRADALAADGSAAASAAVFKVSSCTSGRRRLIRKPRCLVSQELGEIRLYALLLYQLPWLILGFGCLYWLASLLSVFFFFLSCALPVKSMNYSVPDLLLNRTGGS